MNLLKLKQVGNNRTVKLAAFLFVLAFNAKAQDMRIECGAESVTYENGNKAHFAMVLHCPYKEYKSEKMLPKPIVALNRKYLQSRAGQKFLVKAKMVACYEVDFANKALEKYPSWTTAADKRVKYAFEYSFNVQDGMKYYFTTVYDSLGNMLSSDQLPDYKKNADFNKIIPVCKAKSIVEADTRYTGPMHNISLQYSDSVNAFVWEVEIAPLRGNNNLTSANRYMLVNANTGALVKYYSTEVISVENRTGNEKNN